MASELDALLARVDDETLRRDLTEQFQRLRHKRQFGLVFEDHIPERVRLPDHPIRTGIGVVRRDADADAQPSRVARIVDGMASLVGSDGEVANEAVDALVAVAEFGQPIYPGFRHLDSVQRGGDKPAHVVIKGENYHALEALQFTHAGKIDCIYIDPPYNTGARDWTYNNDYVDGNDSFRHSKWLSFMERRLVLARSLLAQDGTIVVTIDEHEVNNLGLLLRQTYPDARVQLVTIVMNTAGSMTPGQFARADEYAYFCRFGAAQAAPLETDLLSGSSSPPQLWFPFHRSRGLNDRPSKRPNLVYPIAIDPASLTVHAIGPSLEERVASGEVSGDLDEWMPDLSEKLDGRPVVWPILDSGEMSVWQANADGLRDLIQDGFFRIREPRSSEGSRPFTLAYVKSGNRRKVLTGEFETVGYEPGGARTISAVPQDKTVKTVWKVPEHDARLYGTTMLRALVGQSAFTYPKSPYAVADTLRTVVSSKKNAVILDFFAGSGTTLQAVSMLNSEDDGRRQAILVTNNEVEHQTAARLKDEGLRPGDEEYEAKGVYFAVTVPRVRAVITGERNGEPVPGNYVNGRNLADGAEENAAFLELTYLDAEDVQLDLAFAGVAPLLWLRAGAEGPILDECLDGAGRRKPYAYTETYGVLFNPDCWRTFVERLPGSVQTVFVVTDSPSEFSGIVAELPTDVEAVRLYENYLSTFAINQGR